MLEFVHSSLLCLYIRCVSRFVPSHSSTSKKATAGDDHVPTISQIRSTSKRDEDLQAERALSAPLLVTMGVCSYNERGQGHSTCMLALCVKCNFVRRIEKSAVSATSCCLPSCCASYPWLQAGPDPGVWWPQGSNCANTLLVYNPPFSCEKYCIAAGVNAEFMIEVKDTVVRAIASLGGCG